VALHEYRWRPRKRRFGGRRFAREDSR
jgi:hypothetical protein